MPETRPLGLAAPAWSEAAIDTMACLVCVLDADARLLYFNHACVDVSGWSAAEVLGRPFWEVLIPPEDVEQRRARLTRVLHGDVPASLQAPHAFETVWRTRSGGRRNLALRCAVIGEGDAAVVVTTGVDVTDAREVERALAELDEHHHLLVESSTEMIARYSLDGVLEYVSPACKLLLGIEPAELVGGSPYARMHDDDVPAAREAFAEIVRTGGPVRLELRLSARDGRSVWVESTGHAVLGEGGETRFVQTQMRDITERRRVADALRAAQSEIGVLFDGAPLAMALLTIDGVVQKVNPAMCAFLGYRAEELVGEPWQRFTHPDDVAETAQERDRLLAGEQVAIALEKRYRRRDGSDAWGRLAASVVEAADGTPQFLAQVMDIGEQRRAQEDLQHASLHDPLTGLPNRVLFADRLTLALVRAQADGRPLGVLYCDLDRFKLVNDAFGHGEGDRLLSRAAERLRRALRAEDTIARVGGDEFAVICESARDEGGVLAIADRVVAELSEPFPLGAAAGEHASVGVSVGIAFAGAGSTADELLSHGEAAMYGAKTEGRGRAAVYHGGLGAQAASLLRLHTDLRRAIERDELVPYFQPQIDLASGAMIGAEALVRWLHPERGVLPPGDFVPLAEETGLVLGLGAAVLRAACVEAAGWRRYGPLPIAVNVSAVQLADPDFPALVERSLVESGLPAQRLCLEVTEGALVRATVDVDDVFRRLRGLGVRLAIDDFGTGYATFEYARRLPFDTLKIHGSFVRGLGRDVRDEGIVASILLLAGALGVGVIAEGVETALQREHLVDAGCAVGQGFLFARPMDAAALQRYLAERTKV